MAWIVGIVCIILFAIFWRIFLPLAVVGAVVIGGFLLYVDKENTKRERERERAEQSLQKTFAAAINNASSVEREWTVHMMRDPASGASVARDASVLADNGLCTLQVEQRIDATRLTGIYCPGFKIDHSGGIDVKFDNRPTSDPMRLATFSNGDDVYIASQPTYNHLHYDEFLRRLGNARKVALRIKFFAAGDHWIPFSLKHAGPALIQIGAVKEIKVAPPDLQPTIAKSRATSSEATSTTSQSTEARSGLVADATGSQSTEARSTKSSAGIPKLPMHAELDYTGNNWKCQRGYRRVGNECNAVQLPMHAELDYTGSNWKCQRGYHRVGSECNAVQLPMHAELDYTGSNWKCQRGYARSAGDCVPVRVPQNGELDYTGNNWKCQRGYRRAGAECVPVGVVSTN